MDPLDFGVILALQTPVYYALWDIQRKIGKYDQVCRDFDTLKAAHDKIIGAGGHDP